jgi:hypothetical protein
MLKRLLGLSLFAAALIGCDKFPNLLFSNFFSDDAPITLLDKPAVVGPDPMRLAKPGEIKVLGDETELCITLSDHFAGINETADAISAEYKKLIGDAHPVIALHASNGKDYTWQCNGWQVSGMQPGRASLNACFKWECNQDQAPPKSTEIASIDLKSDLPLQILGATWSSTAAFDSISKPPPDPLATSSSEYADLEKAFSGEAAWATEGKLALKIELESARRERSFSHFNSTLYFRLSESGIQLQPASNTVGMGIVTIPASAVTACSMRSWGPLAHENEIILPDPGIVLGALNTPEIIDWCWDHHLPMISARDRDEWLHQGKPFPTGKAVMAQFESREAYDQRVKQLSAGF